jgi:hypothetical protein
MNAIGAALLACAAAGCAWSAWVSLRGRWRVVVITVSAVLAVLVPVVQLSGSTATIERASPPPPEPVAGHEPAPAPAVEASPLPAAAEPAVETPVPPVEAELAVAPVAEDAVPVGPDFDVELAAVQATPRGRDVQPPPERHRAVVPQASGTVEVPPAAEAPTAVRIATVVTPAPASAGHKPKQAPRQEHPKKAKAAPAAQRRRH